MHSEPMVGSFQWQRQQQNSRGLLALGSVFADYVSVISGAGALEMSLNRAFALAIQSSSVEWGKPVFGAQFYNTS